MKLFCGAESFKAFLGLPFVLKAFCQITLEGQRLTQKLSMLKNNGDMQ